MFPMMSGGRGIRWSGFFLRRSLTPPCLPRFLFFLFHFNLPKPFGSFQIKSGIWFVKPVTLAKLMVFSCSSVSLGYVILVVWLTASVTMPLAKGPIRRIHSTTRERKSISNWWRHRSTYSMRLKTPQTSKTTLKNKNTSTSNSQSLPVAVCTCARLCS